MSTQPTGAAAMSNGVARLAVLALAALLASACQTTGVKRSFTGADAYEDGGGRVAYGRSLNRWTREMRLYDLWETSLWMNALYRGEHFRRSWSHEYARRFILPVEDYALLVDKELADAAAFHEIVFSVWARDSKGGDFGGSDAPWKVRLVGDDGRTVAPLTLERVRKPSTELLSMYPFIGAQQRLYIARFPVLAGDGLPLITPRSRTLKMQVAGVLNRGEIVWDVRGP